MECGIIIQIAIFPTHGLGNVIKSGIWADIGFWMKTVSYRKQLNVQIDGMECKKVSFIKYGHIGCYSIKQFVTSGSKWLTS